MLVLSRKQGEQIVIDGSIVITVQRLKGNKVSLGIIAPREMVVNRAGGPTEPPAPEPTVST